jgi:hypothetical protein
MSRSHGVEWIDLKSARLCRTCGVAIPIRASLKTQNINPSLPSSKIH